MPFGIFLTKYQTHLTVLMGCSFKENSSSKKDGETSMATQNVEISWYLITTAGTHITDDRLGSLFVTDCVKCVSETILLPRSFFNTCIHKN